MEIDYRESDILKLNGALGKSVCITNSKRIPGRTLLV